uniref:Uncharacterized protein n=1 Tax=Avena sativa TaxID=4498 RepID=A0ACD5YF70_AVESA
MAGLAVSALPLAAGSSLLRLRNIAPRCCLTRPPLLKVAKPQPFVLRRFAPASRRRCTAASSSGRQGLRAGQYQFDDDEPLWLAVVREFAAGFRSLVAFLADQPRQLKYLEWPGFQNTLRTATLTLILVAVFIVALSSVDAALSYILSWLLRKSA